MEAPAGEEGEKSEHKVTESTSQEASEPQNQSSSPNAQQDESAPAKHDKENSKMVAQMSSKQRQLAGAWGQYCRTVERQHASTFQGVEKEVGGITRSLQSNHSSAQEVREQPSHSIIAETDTKG